MTSSRTFVRLGLVALPLVAVAFATRDGVTAGAALLGGGLLITLPALAVAQLGLALPDDVDTMSVYVSSALVIVGLAAVSLLVGAGTLGYEAMGLGAIAPRTLAVGSAIATGAGLGVMVVARLLAARMGWVETELVRMVMPADGRERGAFVVVSAVAGLGEEIAYRGFLLALLLQTFGDPLTAVVLTSIAFGLLHAYQGAVGMIRTGLIGLAFASIAIALGSVWPVVVGHVMINLVAGLLLGEWLLDMES